MEVELQRLEETSWGGGEGGGVPGGWVPQRRESECATVGGSLTTVDKRIEQTFQLCSHLHVMGEDTDRWFHACLLSKGYRESRRQRRRQ